MENPYNQLRDLRGVMLTGDFVYLKRDSVFYETLEPHSGSADSLVVIRDYGNGENPKPKIYGYEDINDWLEVPESNDMNSLTCYKADWTGSPFHNCCGYAFLYEDGVQKTFAKSNKSDLSNNYDWWVDEPNDKVYLLLEHYPNDIAIGKREFCIDLNQRDYITIKNIEVGGSISSAILVSNNTGTVIENVYISSSGYAGIGIGNGPMNTRIQNCEITECDHAGIFANDVGGDTTDGLRIYNNYIHDVKLEGMAFERYMRSVEVVGNVIINVDADQHGGSPDGVGIWLQQLDDEEAKYIIRNNTIMDCEQTCFLAECNDLNASLVVANNIFDNSSQPAISPCVIYGYWYGITNNNYINYNCYHKQKTSDDLIWLKINDFRNKYSLLDFASYQTETGLDTHSIAQDPNLNPDGSLGYSSPCINAGEPVYGGGFKTIGAWLPSAFIQSDLNHDGKIDFRDFAILANHWLQEAD